MKITNKTNLPRAFVEMAKREYEYIPKTYSVTQLLKGTRETILLRHYHKDIEVDVADMIWMLFGQATHYILEQQQEGDSELKEERFYIPVNGYTLTGKFDLYCGEAFKITDYKTCSVWKIIKEDYEDWKKQLGMYCYLAIENGFFADKGDIIALMKDHSKREAKRKSDYPKLPARRVSFKFDDEDFKHIEGFITEKIEEIKLSETLKDEELPLCTAEERWNTGDKFAVMKKGNKRALRVLDSEEEAQKWMQENGKGDHIELRLGEDIKCNDYCFVNTFCDYYLSQQEEEKELQEVPF